MTPTAEPGDPSQAAGRGMIAAPAHPSLSELQPPRGRNQPQKEEGRGEEEERRGGKEEIREGVRIGGMEVKRQTDKERTEES